VEKAKHPSTKQNQHHHLLEEQRKSSDHELIIESGDKAFPKLLDMTLQPRKDRSTYDRWISAS